ncbi:MAG: CHAD domain-containing protein [Phycisphaerales bacterium]|nr:CHAD domain-containing protein [Phycisphaerales bacterium]
MGRFLSKAALGELSAQTPSGEAATIMLADAARRVAEHLPGDVADLEDERLVHKLRVSTRRAAAVARGFKGVVRTKDLERLRKTLKRIRRAAGPLRDRDVLEALVEERMAGTADRPQTLGLSYCAGVLGARALSERRSGWEALQRPRIQRLVADAERAKVRKGARETPLGELGKTRIAAAREAFNDARRADLRDIENLHALRIAGKRLRYSMELFGRFTVMPDLKTDLKRLKTLQDDLGDINDLRTLAEFAEEVAEIAPADGPTAEGLRAAINALRADERRAGEAAAEQLRPRHSNGRAPAPGARPPISTISTLGG